MAERHHRKIDRRSFMRRAGGTALALPTASAILAACTKPGETGNATGSSGPVDVARPGDPVTLPLNGEPIPTDVEPYLRSATSVLPTDHGYRAWYVSATAWTTVNDEPYPRYVVRCADSADGLRWPDRGRLCIDLDDDEFGIGRPWVIHDTGCYRMWYSIRARSRPYRIGYAESADGVHWERRDHEAGIEASASGWDSEMICYAAVIDVNGRRLMFYNGNRHGATGFGVAELER